MKTRKYAIATAKVIAATLVVWSAGWAIVTLSPRGAELGVQEAEADIWGLNFAEKTKQEKFVGTLQEMGMEKPRAYNWNGNRVFFSTMTTSESPQAVLRRFQDEFQANGVNKKAHYSIPNKFSFKTAGDIVNASPAEKKKHEKEIEQFMDWQDDFWTGGVVPTRISDDMIQMMGTETTEKSSSAIDALKRIREMDGRPDKNVDVMHYIDALREPSGRTRVTSVWSDENLDLSKFQGEEGFVDREYREDHIPACMGCKRLMRFEGTAAEKAYVANVFEGTATAESSLEYYEKALANRGWERSDSSKVMDRAREIGMMPTDIGKLDVYAKGGQFLTVTAQPSESGTIVQVMEMP